MRLKDDESKSDDADGDRDGVEGEEKVCLRLQSARSLLLHVS